MENNKKNNNVLLILIIVLQLAILGVLGYYTFFKEDVKDTKEINKTNESNNQAEEQTDEQFVVLTKDSEIVQWLYQDITLTDQGSSTNSLWNMIVANTKDYKFSVATKDIAQQVKNNFGFEKLTLKGVEVVPCSTKYSATIKAYDKNLECGLLDPENDYKTHEKNVRVVEESYLKASVEKLFGTGSYSPKEFGLYFEKYIYYAPDKIYVQAGGIGSNIDLTKVTTTLKNVSNTKDTLILTVTMKLTNADSEAVTELDYNFTYKLDNNNYYLYSIETAKG